MTVTHKHNTHVIALKEGWITEIEKTLEKANHGDTIQVASPAQLQFGNMANKRICPDKVIQWRVGPEIQIWID
jgi:hypothetical protein